MNYIPFKKKNEYGGYVSAKDLYKDAYNPSSLTESVKNNVANKPTESAPSFVPDYATMSKEYMDQYLTRKPFEFDVNADMLYQQYRKQAAESGRMAMEDTMARAAAITGGYGNSYAMAAGQQAYQKQLDSADAMIPELYQLARSRYDAEGQDLLNKASAAASMIPGATETKGVGYDATENAAHIAYLTGDSTFEQKQAYFDALEHNYLYNTLMNSLTADNTWNSSYNPNVKGSRYRDLDATEYSLVDDGGNRSGKLNDDAVIKVKGKEMTIEKLYEMLLDEGMTRKDAKNYIIAIQKRLGIKGGDPS